MLEEELKIDIAGREAHERIRERLGEICLEPPKVLEQRNFYFDTADLRLAGAGAMLRLRSEGAGGGKILTYKNGPPPEDGVFRAQEYETPLSERHARRILEQPSQIYQYRLPPVEKLEEDFGLLPLELIGELRNERRRCVLEGFTVELDRMSFAGGGEAYELEIETADPAAVRRWCEDLLAELGVEWKYSDCTKFERLLRRMGRR
jgi:inorganic triphosphatase YgiF